MPEIKRLTSHISQELLEQVVSMGQSFVTDLSMSHIPSSSPLHGIYSEILAVELRLHLERIGLAGASSCELIVAQDKEQQDHICGFLLYMPMPDSLGACAVGYMAVQILHQGKGLGAAMLAEMRELYPNAGLTCLPSLVPYYERQGFRVTGHRFTQVEMTAGVGPVYGALDVADSQYVSNCPSVVAVRQSVSEAIGPAQFKQALVDFRLHASKLSESAQAFAKAEMGD